MKPGYNILVGRELWGATTSNPVTFAGRVDTFAGSVDTIAGSEVLLSKNSKIFKINLIKYF